MTTAMDVTSLSFHNNDNKQRTNPTACHEVYALSPLDFSFAPLSPVENRRKKSHLDTKEE